MQMVVMDWVDTQKPPKNAYEQIKKVLKLLHDRGYVFGDLRMPNVLFDKDGVKFIDFNWCGPYRDGQEKQIDEADGQVEPNYAYYPLSMSNLAGMWALGMEPLAEIRPEHDLAMLEKLFCNT
jgi:serine/threonine protein kinase